MIYWFTGQPGAGKTTLANKLAEDLYHAFHIDGDRMRSLFTNTDYSINGRVKNVETAQRIAQYLNFLDHDVIVSLVAPYIDQREDFKKIMGDQLIEIYVHTSEIRERDHFKSIAYTSPQENFLDIDTTNRTVEESYSELLQKLK